MFSILTLVDGSEVYDKATAKEKGEPALEPSERRRKIIKIISIRRYDMMRNLACEFGVFWQTIFRDMQVLAEEYPLIITRENCACTNEISCRQIFTYSSD